MAYLSKVAVMLQGSLFPYLRDAVSHVEVMLGASGEALVALARSHLARDLAVLGSVSIRPSRRLVANVAAELLCLTEYLTHRRGALPAENVPDSGDAGSLDDDARRLGALRVPLTQDDLARALRHLKLLVDSHGIDLVQSLALEMKSERLRQVAWQASRPGTRLGWALP